MRTFTLILLVLAPLALAACGESGGPDRLRLATTTSTRDSGLLAYLLEPFEAESGIDVQVVGVGTGQALALGRRGDADIVLVHARELEDGFVAEGHGTGRRDVMWNDFVIAGPASDPAHVKGLKDPVDALAAIRSQRALFVSRGDNSGTHVREMALWKRAAIDPTSGAGWKEWYWRAGQGMGACLTIADEKRGYILVDRGTLIAFRGKVEVAALVEGHESLRNPYGIILVNPKRHPHVNAVAARRLAEWLSSTAGQARIAAYRLHGEALFHPVATE